MDKNKLIKFAKEQCEIFPEDSYMGEYLRETIKILQAEPCEDAISRAEAIRIASGYCHPSNVAKELANLPPVKPTQNWIPVSERLPNIKNRREGYLVTLKDKTVHDAIFTEYDGEHWWNYNCDDVIAWQPLPEPYKKETESEE